MKALGIPEYFPLDPLTGEMEGYRIAGSACRPVAPASAGRLPSEEQGLHLGLWEGEYNRLPGRWARWFTPDGQLVLTKNEDAEARAAAAADCAAAEAAQRAEAEARAAALAERVAALEAELRRR